MKHVSVVLIVMVMVAFAFLIFIVQMEGGVAMDSDGAGSDLILANLVEEYVHDWKSFGWMMIKSEVGGK